ncbi:MAG TPA: HAD family hydrolase [Flavobacteriales bacterium]|jgi:3-deoxy-D-manno-octulosonate 8-phosphate phosphatase (KDO 8-P phosphatase)|nr:HAD family hydrolase [Flavobacteriales bacterium]
MNYKTKLANIELFAFDYDGVFTDGTVLLMPDGSEVRQASTRDGFAVQWAVKQGLKLALLTGGSEKAVAARMVKLGIQEVHLRCEDKFESLKALCENLQIPLDKVAYMGDDIPDIIAMREVGLAACPEDAVEEVRNIAQYISPKGGGKGCVRDLLEQAMRLKGIWS